MKIAGVLGLAVLLLIWAPPWGAWVGMFPAHMVRHMGLVAVAAPLLVLGFPTWTSIFAVSPLLAAVLEFVVVWGFHLPAMHQAAMHSSTAFVVEQGVFLIVGLCVWAGCLRTGGLAGAGGLLLTSMHMTLLGALLTLAPRPLYRMGEMADGALAEQQLGGMLMLAIGTPIYLVAGLWLVSGTLALDKEQIP
ncbi:cytochrome c oxidase assembly protein [Loktanella sp. SALINAS62]|uniref:cytochrome c oxidase assembly protein n=1 Tax=Loktanella sp. SALINAS62 TaxID=2706124 RepID=UPI001B8AA950|nr:cytochrome c oxidase assembly protein [Loktanella sp. SALINAS62]MBS1300959.1 cytochrome c oxidase assembly protein [Loktanella sp. SALINAS62]